ncbi:hypothetical protein HZA87_00490 [Candidatus Uhrbacteria bacterium]|nr:hypothetical protein [Candidatus Uhrbacteria bacterium]
MSRVPYRMIGYRIGRIVRDLPFVCLSVSMTLAATFAAGFFTYATVCAIVNFTGAHSLVQIGVCAVLSTAMWVASWVCWQALIDLVKHFRGRLTTYHVPITPSRQ